MTGSSIWTSESQAKPPAPPMWLDELRALVGQAFSLPPEVGGSKWAA